MRQDLNLEASFKRFVMFAATLAAFGSLFVTNAKAQGTIWTVTIDVNGKKDRPVYSVSSVPPGAPNCAVANPKPAPDAEHLYVCQGDFIYWIVTASSPKYTVTVFTEQAILDNADKEATQWHHGSSDGTSTVRAGGPINDHTTVGTYPYSVAVFDPSANHLYAHDPKIMIGTGNTKEALIDSIVIDTKQLSELLQDGSDKEKAQAQQLIHQADELKHLIDSQRRPK